MTIQGNHKPSLSVVMAVHDTARYLPAAIRSILEQTFTDFEFIIVDDGSIDRTPDILRRFAKQDARIRLIRQSHAGLTEALRRGVAESTADVIARMDGDDISLPKRLELQLRFLRDHPDVVAVGGQIHNIDTFGGYIGENPRSIDHASIDQRLLGGDGAAICHPAVMFRRDAYDKVGGYDATYRTAQDLDLFLKFGEVGRLANLDRYVLMYRIHHGSTNATRQALQLENRERIVRAACGRRNLEFVRAELVDWPLSTAADKYRALAWLNLARSQVAAARRHALSALIREPFRACYWEVLAHCLRGR